ncbi:hypothetical protein CEXT_708131 [Caerostris extrusa]|uniref:Uncharacterized protein n=1 Tax=Caerostris extrusa TaxID=172846 RepID=A0AAV4NBV0_CAEEX|nr:hypothetical protein CEXT_708131 [Caerostris extrusa]
MDAAGKRWGLLSCHVDVSFMSPGTVWKRIPAKRVLLQRSRQKIAVHVMDRFFNSKGRKEHRRITVPRHSDFLMESRPGQEASCQRLRCSQRKSPFQRLAPAA